MTKKYQIAVIGPIPRDHITTYKGRVIEKYGCITHPTVVLSNLLGDSAQIISVSHIRKVDEPAIMAILKDLPGVDVRYVDSEQDQGDVIELRFLDQTERVKSMRAFMNPITVNDVKNILDSDVFLFLPVTDFEVALETLKFIKEHSDGLIIFDAHGPTKTVTALGDRLSKFWIDRDLWLPYIDILKMNRKETRYCWLKKRYTLDQLENDIPLDATELPNFAKHCLKYGVKALYITHDVKGCLVYTEDANGELREETVPGVPVDNIIDSTGCGDAFAGGLAYGLLTTNNDYIKAAQYANALGAQALQAINFEGFKSLKETEQIIHNTYDTK
jgi:hypothetical protein